MRTWLSLALFPLLFLAGFASYGQSSPAQTPSIARGVHQLRARDGTLSATYLVPELVGAYSDDFGQSSLQLFANGTGTFRLKDGTNQHVRWGLRIDDASDPESRYFTRDTDGQLVYVILFEHLNGDKLFEYEQAEYLPNFRGRNGALYLVIQRSATRVWALQKTKK